jgi:hypothetical protein
VAENKVLFYPVWVTTSGGMGSRTDSSLRWGPACDTPGIARQEGKARVEQGQATLSFVVRFGDTRRTPMPTYIYPQHAAVIVRHWLELVDAVARPTAAPPVGH